MKLLCRSILGVVLFAILGTGCVTHRAQIYDASQPELKELILAPLPEWAKDPIAEGYYLDIDRVMEAYHLGRYEAMDLQKQMRDGLEDQSVSIAEAFDKGLKAVQSQKFSTGWKQINFKRPEEYLVVLAGRGSDFKAAETELVLDLKRDPRCKGVVLFVSDRSPVLPVKLSEAVGGVFTQNHFYLGKGSPAPSRDLRMLDPTLSHIVLVSRDLTRVLQPELLLILNSKKNLEDLKTFQQIQKAATRAQETGTSFSEALKAFSYSGTAAPSPLGSGAPQTRPLTNRSRP